MGYACPEPGADRGFCGESLSGEAQVDGPPSQSPRAATPRWALDSRLAWAVSRPWQALEHQRPAAGANDRENTRRPSPVGGRGPRKLCPLTRAGAGEQRAPQGRAVPSCKAPGPSELRSLGLPLSSQKLRSREGRGGHRAINLGVRSAETSSVLLNQGHCHHLTKEAGVALKPGGTSTMGPLPATGAEAAPFGSCENRWLHFQRRSQQCRVFGLCEVKRSRNVPVSHLSSPPSPPLNWVFKPLALSLLIASLQSYLETSCSTH